MKEFQQDCQFPDEMLDDNLAMDKGKLAYISSLPYGEQVIVQALNGETPLTLERLVNRFGVEDVLTQPKDITFMISLLYYFGILTQAGVNEMGDLLFKIPNLVIKKLYVEQLRELLLPDSMEQTQSRQLARQFYKSGDLQRVVWEYI